MLLQDYIKQNKEIHYRNTDPKQLKHRTILQRKKDGQLNITANISNIYLLFLENGSKQFNGKFWKEYETIQKTLTNGFDISFIDPKDKQLISKLKTEKEWNDFMTTPRMKASPETIINFFKIFQFFLKIAIDESCYTNINDIKETWNISKMQLFLKKHGIEAIPMPNDKNILFKIINQFFLLQDKLNTIANNITNTYKIMNKYLNCDSSLKTMLKNEPKLAQSDSEYSDDEMELKTNIKLTINSQYLIPDNLDLNKLKEWNINNHGSLTQIFYFFQMFSRTCSLGGVSKEEYAKCLSKFSSINNSSNCNDYNNLGLNDPDIMKTMLKMKLSMNKNKWESLYGIDSLNTFDRVEQLFFFIVGGIDCYGINNINNIPPIVLTDNEINESDVKKFEFNLKNKDFTISKFNYVIDSIIKFNNQMANRQIWIIICFVKCLDSFEAFFKNNVYDNNTMATIKNRQIPIICIKYRDCHRSRESQSNKKDIAREVFYNGENRSDEVKTFVTSIESMAMMINLLRNNRKKLKQSVLKEIETKYISKENFKYWKCSVFIPYCPKDGNATICPVCDKTVTAMCARCKKIGYCSRECQKKHWNSGHKNNCQTD